MVRKTVVVNPVKSKIVDMKLLADYFFLKLKRSNRTFI